jgi:lipopolysaccharide biosynthesis regulator YciM
VVSLYREKARLLQKRGARDAALAVLERALRAAPAHPLLIADYLDLAEEAGRPDAIAALLEGPLAEHEGTRLPAALAGRREEALLRRAESAARSGALGEAIQALDRLPPGSRMEPLAALARVRILARLGDADGLAQAFAAHADALLEERSDLERPADPARRREAAHFLVRAATARREFHQDTAGAEACLRRAIALAPDYGPALEGLRSVLADKGEWRALAASFEEEEAHASDEPARQALRASLAVLYRDLLRDPEAARRFEAAGDGDGDAMRTLARAADQAGQRFVSTGDGADEAVRSLCALGDQITDSVVAANLRLLAGRLASQAGAHTGALALYEEAIRRDPGSLAAAALERRHREAGRSDDVLRVLTAELRAADSGGRKEVARALRFRAAFAAAEGGRPEEALKTLAPLREARDQAAVAWSRELARASGQPALAAALHQEVQPPEAGGDQTIEGERLLSLGEAREALGDLATAATAFGAAAGSGGGATAVDAALGALRARTAAGARAQAREAMSLLADTLHGSPGAAEARREADLLLGAANVPGMSDETGPEAADGVRDWLRGLRAGDAASALRGLERLAVTSASDETSAELWAAIGLRRRLGAQPGAQAGAWDMLRRASRAPLLAEMAITDLCASPTGGSPEAPPDALATARRQRAERLAAAGGAGPGLALALHLEEAIDAEAEGRGRAAAETYSKALALDPASWEAVEGLRRIAHLAGDGKGEAAALMRQGALLRDPRRAAERFAEAALLLEDQGLIDEAAAAFREVLVRVPEDDEAYRRLHDLVTGRRDAPALERLISFKLQATRDPAARAALYAERAAVRLDRLERRREAIHDHRRALDLDPERVDSLRVLARLAMEEERHAIAARYLEQALTAARDDDAKADLRVELATAYESAGEAARAIEVLRAAVEARPADVGPRERLVELGLRERKLDLAIRELEGLQGLASAPAARAAIAVRIGRIERDQRHDRERALAAFRSALGLDALGTRPPSWCARWARARWRPRTPRRPTR